MTSDEKKRQPPQTPHSLRLEERQRLYVSGVEEVVSFHEEEVSVRTVQGLLRIAGTGLHVDKLEKTAGELSISGLVTELGYEETGPGTGFLARLFR